MATEETVTMEDMEIVTVGAMEMAAPPDVPPHRITAFRRGLS